MRRHWIALLLILILFALTACGRKATDSALEERYPGLTIHESPSGLKYIVIEEGTGRAPVFGDVVQVHYIGTLDDGSQFDSSYERGEPLEFVLGTGRVIAGWDEGIALMRVGGKSIIIVPPELGYGEQGFPPIIPPNATLHFEVVLVAIVE